MKVLQFILSTILLFTISFSALAHDGHDHGSIYASLIHLLWLAPALIALSFLYSRILSQLYKMDK